MQRIGIGQSIIITVLVGLLIGVGFLASLGQRGRLLPA
jgi:hypothetical protein